MPGDLAQAPETKAPATISLEVLTNADPTSDEIQTTDVDDRPICACTATAQTGRTIEERRTLELACRLYSDEFCRHEFSVFATPRHGDRTAVIARRSTGDCGACGALAIAAVFQKGELEAIGELGQFGRMGNGPDGVRWVEVAGEPALEVTSSISKGGYTDEYREVFLRDGDGFRSGTCIQTAWDDGGAHEKPSEWKARLDYRSDGAIDIHYTAVRRGDHAMPDLTTSRMSFDRANRRWSFDGEDGCATPPDPRANDVMFYEPGPN